MNKGCIHCKKCKSIRNNYFCGNTKLTQKQLYNDKGHCSEFEDKETDMSGKTVEDRYSDLIVFPDQPKRQLPNPDVHEDV